MNGGAMMMHFEAEEWSDFARNGAYDDRRGAMQRHLETGCKSCMETIALGEKVANATAAEASYQPALEGARTVKAAFATVGLAARRQETNCFIELLFDSFSQPRLAGTRSAAMRIRQLLYRVEPYQIDLHIELQPEHNRLVVSGQLVDLSDPEMVGRDVQVMLSDAREFIVNTVTNEFGEFLGEIKDSGDLEISFLGRKGKPIVILIRGPLQPLSAAKE
jgi:hypothetical protein